MGAGPSNIDANLKDVIQFGSKKQKRSHMVIAHLQMNKGTHNLRFSLVEHT